MNTLKQSIIGVTILACLYGCGGGGTDSSATNSDSTIGVKTATPATVTTTADQTSTQSSNTTQTTSAKSSSTSSNTSALHTKLGYNYHDYYDVTDGNSTQNVNVAKSMLAAGVKWARVYRMATWGVDHNEDNALLEFMKAFRAGGGKVLFTLDFDINNFNNLANDSNQRNALADIIMNGPRGFRYTWAKYGGNIDAIEFNNEYQAKGGWNPNNASSSNSGTAYARVMNVVIPQVRSIASTLPLYPSSNIENNTVTVEQGAQFTADVYTNSSDFAKAAWAGPNLHIYDHTSKTAAGIIGKFNTISGIVDKAWPNAKYVITEVGITTGTHGEYSGATVYTPAMQRDILVGIATSWAANSKINFWNFYEWHDKYNNPGDGESSFGTLTFNLQEKSVSTGRTLYDTWAATP